MIKATYRHGNTEIIFYPDTQEDLEILMSYFGSKHDKPKKHQSKQVKCINCGYRTRAMDKICYRCKGT